MSATLHLPLVLLVSMCSARHSLNVCRPDNEISSCSIDRGLSAYYASTPKRPVIIDTDIGSYMDDTFAIVYAALCQDLDVKLIITCTDDTTARAKVTAKLLNIIGRSDIPIGIGIKNENETMHSLFDWARMENLANYKGGVYEDGIGKMAAVIADSPIVVDILAIGPMTNFPQLIQKYPESVKNARIMAMAGSIYRGYGNSSGPVAEYNVAVCPWCFEVLLNAGWNIAIAPLDITCTLRLDSHKLKQVLEANQMPSLALASSLLFYCLTNMHDTCDLRNLGSPPLHDVAATLLTLHGTAKKFVEFEVMMLRVNGTGFTLQDKKSGTPVSVAISWKDKAKFTECLTEILTQMP